MAKYIAVLEALLLGVLFTFAVHGKDQPDYWPFVKTSDGHPPYQSPISISTSQVKEVDILTPLEWHLFWDVEEKENVLVINNGHTVEVEMAEGFKTKPSLIGGPLLNDDVFLFEQMHFHWGGVKACGTEHRIDGHCYSIEVHLLHWNKKYGTVDEAKKHADGITVLTFFGQHSEQDNDDLEGLLSAIKDIKKPNAQVPKTFGEEFLFLHTHLQSQKYIAYPGSLTTANYEECVTWILCLDMFDISPNQLAQFRTLESGDDVDGKHIDITQNTRSLQDLNDRPMVKPKSSKEEIIIVEN